MINLGGEVVWILLLLCLRRCFVELVDLLGEGVSELSWLYALLWYEDALSGPAYPPLLANPTIDFTRLILNSVLHIQRQLHLFILSLILHNLERRDPLLNWHFHTDMTLMSLNLNCAIFLLHDLAVLACGLGLPLVDCGVEFPQ